MQAIAVEFSPKLPSLGLERGRELLRLLADAGYWLCELYFRQPLEPPRRSLWSSVAGGQVGPSSGGAGGKTGSGSGGGGGVDAAVEQAGSEAGRAACRVIGTDAASTDAFAARIHGCRDDRGLCFTDVLAVRQDVLPLVRDRIELQ